MAPSSAKRISTYRVRRRVFQTFFNTPKRYVHTPSQNYAPEKHTDRLDHANIILDSFHQQFATRVRQKLLRDNFRCGDVRTKVGVTISTDMLKMNFLFWGQNMPQKCEYVGVDIHHGAFIVRWPFTADRWPLTLGIDHCPLLLARVSKLAHTQKLSIFSRHMPSCHSNFPFPTKPHRDNFDGSDTFPHNKGKKPHTQFLDGPFGLFPEESTSSPWREKRDVGPFTNPPRNSPWDQMKVRARQLVPDALENALMGREGWRKGGGRGEGDITISSRISAATCTYTSTFCPPLRWISSWELSMILSRISFMVCRQGLRDLTLDRSQPCNPWSCQSDLRHLILGRSPTQSFTPPTRPSPSHGQALMGLSDVRRGYIDELLLDAFLLVLSPAKNRHLRPIREPIHRLHESSGLIPGCFCFFWAINTAEFHGLTHASFFFWPINLDVRSIQRSWRTVMFTPCMSYTTSTYTSSVTRRSSHGPPSWRAALAPQLSPRCTQQMCSWGLHIASSKVSFIFMMVGTGHIGDPLRHDLRIGHLLGHRDIDDVLVDALRDAFFRDNHTLLHGSCLQLQALLRHRLEHLRPAPSRSLALRHHKNRPFVHPVSVAPNTLTTLAFLGTSKR